MEHFPTPVTVMQLWLSLFWKPFFPALFPYGSYFSYEQQASLPFTLNCPRQPPVEMHWANKGVRVARCPQQCHRCPCHLLKKSHSSEMELHLTFTQRTSHPTVPFTATFSSHTSSQPSEAHRDQGSHCPATHRCQCSWAGMQVHTMLITPADAEHQSGFVWGIDLSLLHPWTNLKTSTQSHIQTWRLFLNC